MRYSIGVAVLSVLVALLLLNNKDVTEASGSDSSYSSTSKSRRRSTYSYTDRRRTSVLDSRRRADYSRRRYVTSSYSTRRRSYITESWQSRRRAYVTEYSRRRRTYVTTYSRRRTLVTNPPSSRRSSKGSAWGILGIIFACAISLTCFFFCCRKGCATAEGPKPVVVTGPPYPRPVTGNVAQTGYTPVQYQDTSACYPPPVVNISHGYTPAPASYPPADAYTPASYPPADGYTPAPGIAGISPAYSSYGHPTSAPHPPAGAEMSQIGAPPPPFPVQPGETETSFTATEDPGPSAPSDGSAPTYDYSCAYVLPPSNVADDPSKHVSAPDDPPPPSYDDLFKS